MKTNQLIAEFLGQKHQEILDLITSRPQATRTFYTSDVATSDTDLSFEGTTTGTDQTTALQALLDQAASGPILVMWNGAYTVDTLKIRSNTHILALPGCGAKAKADSLKPLLQNYNPEPDPDIDTCDHEITVEGGTWNFNAANQSARNSEEEGWFPLLRMAGVRDVKITGNTFIKPKTFTSHASGWRLRWEKNVVLTQNAGNQDGFKFNGPLEDLTVEGNWFDCGDDAVSVCANEGLQEGETVSGFGPFFAAHDIAGPANVRSNFINGPAATGFSLTAFRVLSAGNTVGTVTFENNSGSCRFVALTADNYAEHPENMDTPGAGHIDRINWINNDIAVTDAGYHQAEISVNTVIDALVIDKHHRSVDTDPDVAFVHVSNPAGAIGQLTIKNSRFDVDNADMPPYFVRVQNATIKNLTVEGVNVPAASSATTSYFVNITNSGVVTNLQIANCTTNSLAGWWHVTSGTLTNLSISNCAGGGASGMMALGSGGSTRGFLTTLTPSASEGLMSGSGFIRLFVYDSGSTNYMAFGKATFGTNGLDGTFTEFSRFTKDGALLVGTTGDGGNGLLQVSGGFGLFGPMTNGAATLTYAASVSLNFNTLTASWQTVTLTGDITFTTSTLVPGRTKIVRIVGDSTSRNLTFPAGWKFVGGSAPASLAGNKTAILELQAWGTTDSSVIAKYSVEP